MPVLFKSVSFTARDTYAPSSSTLEGIKGINVRMWPCIKKTACSGRIRLCSGDQDEHRQQSKCLVRPASSLFLLSSHDVVEKQG